MKKEVPDFIADEEKRLKRIKARARRSFLKKLAMTLATIISSGFYLRFEANWLEVTRKKILLPKLKSKTPLKLLHLSDLHFSKSVSLDDIDFSLREGFSLSPDLCVITGDFITNKMPDHELNELSKLLRKYTSQIPTFATLGNHDGGEWASDKGGFSSTSKWKTCYKKGELNCYTTKTNLFILKDNPYQFLEWEIYGQRHAFLMNA